MKFLTRSISLLLALSLTADPSATAYSGTGFTPVRSRQESMFTRQALSIGAGSALHPFLQSIKEWWTRGSDSPFSDSLRGSRMPRSGGEPATGTPPAGPSEFLTAYQREVRTARALLVRYALLHKQARRTDFLSSTKRLETLLKEAGRKIESGQAASLGISDTALQVVKQLNGPPFTAKQSGLMRANTEWLVTMFIPSTDLDSRARKRQLVEILNASTLPKTLPFYSEHLLDAIDAWWQLSPPRRFQALRAANGFSSLMDLENSMGGGHHVNLAALDQRWDFLDSTLPPQNLVEVHVHEKSHTLIDLLFPRFKPTFFEREVSEEDFVTTGFEMLAFARDKGRQTIRDLTEFPPATLPLRRSMFLTGIEASAQPTPRTRAFELTLQIEKMVERSGMERYYLQGAALAGLAYGLAVREAEASGTYKGHDWILANAGRRFIRKMEEGGPWSFPSFVRSFSIPVAIPASGDMSRRDLLRNAAGAVVGGIGIAAAGALLEAAPGITAEQLLPRPQALTKSLPTDAEIRKGLQGLLKARNNFKEEIDRLALLPGWTRAELHQAMDALARRIDTGTLEHNDLGILEVDPLGNTFSVSPEDFDAFMRSGFPLLLRVAIPLASRQRAALQSAEEARVRIDNTLKTLRTGERPDDKAATAIMNTLRSDSILMIRSQWEVEQQSAYYEMALLAVEADRAHQRTKQPLKTVADFAQDRLEVLARTEATTAAEIASRAESGMPLNGEESILYNSYLLSQDFAPGQVSDLATNQAFLRLMLRLESARVISAMMAMTGFAENMGAEALQKIASDRVYRTRFLRWARDTFLRDASPGVPRQVQIRDLMLLFGMATPVDPPGDTQRIVLKERHITAVLTSLDAVRSLLQEDLAFFKSQISILDGLVASLIPLKLGGIISVELYEQVSGLALEIASSKRAESAELLPPLLDQIDSAIDSYRRTHTVPDGTIESAPPVTAALSLPLPANTVPQATRPVLQPPAPLTEAVRMARNEERIQTLQNQIDLMRSFLATDWPARPYRDLLHAMFASVTYLENAKILSRAPLEKLMALRTRQPKTSTAASALFSPLLNDISSEIERYRGTFPVTNEPLPHSGRDTEPLEEQHTYQAGALPGAVDLAIRAVLKDPLNEHEERILIQRGDIIRRIAETDFKWTGNGNFRTLVGNYMSEWAETERPLQGGRLWKPDDVLSNEVFYWLKAGAALPERSAFPASVVRSRSRTALAGAERPATTMELLTTLQSQIETLRSLLEGNNIPPTYARLLHGVFGTLSHLQPAKIFSADLLDKVLIHARKSFKNPVRARNAITPVLDAISAGIERYHAASGTPKKPAEGIEGASHYLGEVFEAVREELHRWVRLLLGGDWTPVMQTLRKGQTVDDARTLKRLLPKLHHAGFVQNPEAFTQRIYFVSPNDIFWRFKPREHVVQTEEELGGLIGRYQGELYCVLSRDRLRTHEGIGDLGHELFEMELLEAGRDPETAHHHALLLQNTFAQKGPGAAKRLAAQLRDPEWRERYPHLAYKMTSSVPDSDQTFPPDDSDGVVGSSPAHRPRRVHSRYKGSMSEAIRFNMLAWIVLGAAAAHWGDAAVGMAFIALPGPPRRATRFLAAAA